MTEVLPLLYLHGLSSKDFVPALEEFFGSKAGLCASVVTRLSMGWQDEQRRFAERDLSGVDYVYVWVDGVHFSVRLDDDRVCTLVVVGVRSDGRTPSPPRNANWSGRQPHLAEGGQQDHGRLSRGGLVGPAGAVADRAVVLAGRHDSVVPSPAANMSLAKVAGRGV